MRYLPGTHIRVNIRRRKGYTYWVLVDEWDPVAGPYAVTLGYEYVSMFYKGGKAVMGFQLDTLKYRTYKRQEKRVEIREPRSVRRYVSRAAAAVYECEIARKIDGWNANESSKVVGTHVSACYAGEDNGWKCLCDSVEAGWSYAAPHGAFGGKRLTLLDN